MPKINGIYWERQKGDLCRKHSINAFLGEEKISDQKFNKYCEEYNKYIKEKFNEEVNTRTFNVFYWKDITEFIIEKFKQIYFSHIPITHWYKYLSQNKFRTNTQAFEKIERALVYNKDHIYCFRKVNNKWYKIDSLRGVQEINLNKINFRKLGVLLGYERKEQFIWEFKRLQLQLANFIEKEKINYKDKDSCEQWIENNYESRLLDSLEIYLNSFLKLNNYLKFNMKFLEEFMNHYHHNKLDKKFFKKFLLVVIYRFSLWKI